ncbi:hypothetical protein GCM10009415_14650 [Chitinophaga japonensis]
MCTGYAVKPAESIHNQVTTFCGDCWHVFHYIKGVKLFAYLKNTGDNEKDRAISDGTCTCGCSNR